MKNFPENGETHGAPSEDATGQRRANPQEVAWLAGIIDGEGSIVATIGGTNGRTVNARLTIPNTSMILMLKVKKVIEDICPDYTKVRIKPRDLKTENIIFIIEIGKQSVIRSVLLACLPHLTTKKSQADEMIAYCDSRAARANYHDTFTEHEWGLPERLKKIRRESFVKLSEGGVETKWKALSSH